MYFNVFTEKIRQEVEKQEEPDFGLSIAQYLVALHKGSIKITRNEPTGTIVSIKLPVK